MKRKYIVFMVLGTLLITIGGTALAATSTETPAPAPVPPSDEAYRQMYEACHGPNGYMTKYFEQNGGTPQNFSGMMNGANYSSMMSNQI